MPYGLPLIYNENKSGPAGDKSRTGQCGITLWRRCRQPQLAQPQSCFLAQFFFSLTFFQSHFSFVSNNFVHRCRQPHLAQPPLFLGPHFFSPSFLFIPVYLLFPISFSPRCRQRQPARPAESSDLAPSSGSTNFYRWEEKFPDWFLVILISTQTRGSINVNKLQAKK